MTGARRAVERIDLRMLFRRQRKTEQVEVLALARGVHRLWDDDRAVFDVPTQNHLRGRHAVRGGDALDGPTRAGHDPMTFTYA